MLIGTSNPHTGDGVPRFVVAVDLHRLPHAIDVVRIAADEAVDRGAVLGVDDEDRADRSLAVVGDSVPAVTTSTSCFAASSRCMR